MNLARAICWFGILLRFSSSLSAQPLVERWQIQSLQPQGEFRLLHGINKGPLAFGGLIDLSTEFKAVGVPWIRLHDCRWPNPDVVDFHAVFPDLNADPSRPESYQFGRTDEYLKASVGSGAQLVYRLGESIEHAVPPLHVHPPKDLQRWTGVCLGIIRHYNEGWNNGLRLGIRYWEIWNEPDTRPMMWTGSDENYFALYQAAALGIKTNFANLKVGGPGFGNTGTIKHGKLQPTAFLTNFLTFARTNQLPLDFLSWHCYTADPYELKVRSEGIRKLLDEAGFAKTESHLNEWNYLPGNSWAALSKKSSAPQREQFYRETSGLGGASFAAAALLLLQTSPVDMANFFHGELGGFGLFTEHGTPNAVYRAFEVFNTLAKSGERLQVTPDTAKPVTVVGAAVRGESISVLLVSLAEKAVQVELQLPGELILLDGRRITGEFPASLRPVPFHELTMTGTMLKAQMEPRGVLFLQLKKNRPAEPAAKQ